jgi:hypothetical protein
VYKTINVGGPAEPAAICRILKIKNLATSNPIPKYTAGFLKLLKN